MYKFQELDSDDEKNGVSLDPAYQRVLNSKQYFNPDELYFNDMDIRAWERRTAELDGLAYGDDYEYQEDEGYYDDAAEAAMSAEYEELLFQRVLGKIRQARATGEPDVQLTPEELEAYQTRLWRPWAPAARPQAARARPVSAPVVGGGASTAVASTSSAAGTLGSGSTRSKKSHRRTSIFGSRSKKEKASGRARAPSNASQPPQEQLTPGFYLPGPDGQPIFTPIGVLHGRVARDTPVRPSGSPEDSRSASVSSEWLASARGAHAGDAVPGVRRAPTPSRITPPREIPGAFPSGSPQRYQEATPPQSARPVSSSSRQSTQDIAEPQVPAASRSRSSSIQTPKLVPFPVTEYKHYNAEPFQYQMAGHLATAPSQPQYSRRVSGPADYTAMPRRVPVPVPVQRATAAQEVQSNQSDPTLTQSAGVEPSAGDGGQGDGLVDAAPQPDTRGYKVQTIKPTSREATSGGSGRESERRKNGRHSRRKY